MAIHDIEMCLDFDVKDGQFDDVIGLYFLVTLSGVITHLFNIELNNIIVKHIQIVQLSFSQESCLSVLCLHLG